MVYFRLDSYWRRTGWLPFQRRTRNCRLMWVLYGHTRLFLLKYRAQNNRKLHLILQLILLCEIGNLITFSTLKIKQRFELVVCAFVCLFLFIFVSIIHCRWQQHRYQCRWSNQELYRNLLNKVLWWNRYIIGPETKVLWRARYVQIKWLFWH